MQSEFNMDAAAMRLALDLVRLYVGVEHLALQDAIQQGKTLLHEGIAALRKLALRSERLIAVSGASSTKPCKKPWTRLMFPQEEKQGEMECSKRSNRFLTQSIFAQKTRDRRRLGQTGPHAFLHLNVSHHSGQASQTYGSCGIWGHCLDKRQMADNRRESVERTVSSKKRIADLRTITCLVSTRQL